MRDDRSNPQFPRCSRTVPGELALGVRGAVISEVCRALVLMLILGVCACAAKTGAPAHSAPPTAATDPPPAADSTVAGVWEGTSTSNCESDPSDPGRCNAQQKITLTMFQQGNSITGFYKCAYGNQVCRHLNETGTIRDGKLKHTRLMFRVMLEDGSMCLFTGRPAANEFEGGYECLQGGGIIEQGIFQTRRTY
jgi:hypothetical protein